MKKLTISMILVLATYASATPSATAYWTGKVKYITTITYKQGVQCKYNYAGNLFWRTFVGSTCPGSVEVQ